MPSEPYHASIADLPAARTVAGVEQTAVEMDNATLQFVRFTPGEFREGGDPTSHPADQVSLVLSGRFAVALYRDDLTELRRVELEPGELLYIPGGMPHKGWLVGDEPVSLVEIFTPVRTEYRALAAAHQPGLAS